VVRGRGRLLKALARFEAGEPVCLPAAGAAPPTPIDRILAPGEDWRRDWHETAE
jgi:hypothetical protein